MIRLLLEKFLLFYIESIKISVKDFQVNPPIIIYQMGKVGSRTVVETLRNTDINRPVFHLHNLSKNGLASSKAKSVSIGRVYPGRVYWVGRYFESTIEDTSRKRIDVIAKELGAEGYNLTLEMPTGISITMVFKI